MQYNEINDFIYNKIKEYNTIFKEYSIAFSSIKYLKSGLTRSGKEPSEYIYSNELFNLLDGEKFDFKMRVFQDYGIDKPNMITYSPSEFLKKITTHSC